MNISQKIRIIAVSLSVIVVLYFIAAGVNSKSDTKPEDRIYGVTITSTLRLSETVEALKQLPKKPTTRIVFDEWVAPEFYNTAVFEINKVSFIMGELLDSYAFDEYTNEEYSQRVSAYLNYYPDKIDIWEIGNEVNGEWLGNQKGVTEKIVTAYKLVKEKNQKAAITFYYNYDCSEDKSNEMFRWIEKNVRSDVRNGLDYVFVSFYEDDCNGTQPDWEKIFDYLHYMFPKAKLGIGECGTKDKSRSEDYIKKYYNMSVKNPHFVGGYFWWYFKRDCVPVSKPGWTVLKGAIESNEKQVNK